MGSWRAQSAQSPFLSRDVSVQSVCLDCCCFDFYSLESWFLSVFLFSWSRKLWATTILIDVTHFQAQWFLPKPRYKLGEAKATQVSDLDQKRLGKYGTWTMLSCTGYWHSRIIINNITSKGTKGILGSPSMASVILAGLPFSPIPSALLKATRSHS